MSDTSFNRRKFLESSAGAAAVAGLGTGSALFAPLAQRADARVQAREGRQAARPALEPLRPGRHRRLHGQRQEVHREDRHRGPRRQRGLGRRPPEGGGRRQHRRRPGHHPVDQRRRESLSRQAARRHRPRRVHRQEVRRLVPRRPGLPEAGRQEVDRPAARRGRRDDRLPREHGEGGRLRHLPEGHRRLPEADEGARTPRARRAAWRSATPPATACGATG